MSGFNLYDYSKAFFSDGAPVPVSKVLVKASPIFATAIVVEGNRDNGHEYAIQNGLPSGAFRKAYEGVVPSKGSTTLVHEKYARYSTASVVDVAVAEKGGNVAQIKADMLADKMEVTAQAGNIAGRVGATVCVVLTLIFRIFTKTYFLSPWVVYFSILTTHTLVKYARLKRKTDLILAILYLAMCLTFFAFFILRLVEVKE